MYCVLGVSMLPLSKIFVLHFGIVPTVWYLLELFRQCGIFWNCSDSVGSFGIVPTVGTAVSCTHNTDRHVLTEIYC
jgi:hypothetical protein